LERAIAETMIVCSAFAVGLQAGSEPGFIRRIERLRTFTGRSTPKGIMKPPLAICVRDELEKLPTGGRDIRHEGRSDPASLTGGSSRKARATASNQRNVARLPCEFARRFIHDGQMVITDVNTHLSEGRPALDENEPRVHLFEHLRNRLTQNNICLVEHNCLMCSILSRTGPHWGKCWPGENWQGTLVACERCPKGCCSAADLVVTNR
jgi:hypothetical protein